MQLFLEKLEDVCRSTNAQYSDDEFFNYSGTSIIPTSFIWTLVYPDSLEELVFG